MTGVEYVKTRLQNDFNERSSSIIALFDKCMEDLLNTSPLENDLTDSFQTLLIDTVYPFLACSQAMQDAGVDIHFADRYVRKINDDWLEDKREYSVP